MKCMIAFACLLAVASAGYINNAAFYGAYDDGSYKGEFYNGNVGSYYAGALGYSAYYGTPSVAYKAPLVSAAHPVKVAQTYAAPIVQTYAQGYKFAAPIAYSGYVAPLATQARLVDPVAIAAGAPLPTGDTVEVAAAKAAHFQAHAAAKGFTYSAYAPALAYSGYAAPIAHAVAPTVAYSGYVAPFASEARLVDPVAIAAGAPLPTGDTVEVAAAKAKHFEAHVAAKAGHSITKRSPVYLNAAYTTPLAYSTPIKSFGYSSYASPLAYTGYTGYTGYGYGGVTPFYG